MESEAQTRRNRIDDCLKQAGWHILPWSRGIDITSLRHHALQEYPTANGPADYALVVDGHCGSKETLDQSCGCISSCRALCVGPRSASPTLRATGNCASSRKAIRVCESDEARRRQAQANVNRLTQSLLVNAFRGELVPTEHTLATAEGRNYETASELLARIQTEQNSATVSVKPKRNRVQQSKGSRS